MKSRIAFVAPLLLLLFATAASAQENPRVICKDSSIPDGFAYFLNNHLGSTAALTDAAGNLIEQLDYDSFGKSSGSSRTRYGYTGRERDPETESCIIARVGTTLMQAGSFLKIRSVLAVET